MATEEELFLFLLLLFFSAAIVTVAAAEKVSKGLVGERGGAEGQCSEDGLEELRLRLKQQIFFFFG